MFNNLLQKEKNIYTQLGILQRVENKLFKKITQQINEILTSVIIKEERKIININLLIIKTRLEEKEHDIFFKQNEIEIEKILESDLSFHNLQIEYDLFCKQVSRIENWKKMSYKDIMTFEYDEDLEEYKKDFDLFTKLVKSVKNVYLFGNAGNGKTTFAYNIAKELGLPLYNINSVKNEYSVKGFFDLDGKYQLSLYEKWYKNGGVLLLDECDSYSSNGTLYLNNGIETGSKYITLENGEVIKKHNDCYVIACANTNGLGKTSEYIGRNTLDLAFLSRFIKKEFKEYAYIHKSILKENYNTFKELFKNNLTTRLCVKINQLLNNFKINELKDMILNKVIEM